MCVYYVHVRVCNKKSLKNSSFLPRARKPAPKTTKEKKKQNKRNKKKTKQKKMRKTQVRQEKKLHNPRAGDLPHPLKQD